MRKLFFIFLSLAFLLQVKAQSASDSIELTIKAGDTLRIGLCSSPNFQHLDMFRKTRWQGNEAVYDTATGNGFYASFFSTGDFDIAELPASYAQRKMVVLGVEVLKNKKTGEPMNILYLIGDIPNSIIWVDFDKAILTGELSPPE